jgi:Major Facilitator Superfamily
MGFRSKDNGSSSDEVQVHDETGGKTSIAHDEKILPPTTHGWKLSSKSADGDTALALFKTLDELHEPIDPEEERKLVWKIDFMILPYLAVCYAFFYVDKTTLSYAAIFGIREDLKLHGTQYNWLSSIFYFGFLVWAFPTNFLMQRLPIGKYLGFNIFLWGFFLMLQAACNSFTTLAVMRALGGAAEACSDPAFMLITSMWYTRRQQPGGLRYCPCFRLLLISDQYELDCGILPTGSVLLLVASSGMASAILRELCHPGSTSSSSLG